jgi:hypothetical protein
MFLECRHVQSSGEKCNSAALRHSLFCYFHRNVLQRAEAPSPRTPFILPFMEDSRGILIAVNDVFRAMGESRIQRSEASTYLHGIQIAARVIARIEDKTWEPVRALEYDDYGAELAEEKTSCDPFLDCLNCDRQDICEVRRAALEKNPEDYIAKMRSMNPAQAWAEFQAKEKARDQRIRRLRSLAVRDNPRETPTHEQATAPRENDRQGLSLQTPSIQATPSQTSPSPQHGKESGSQQASHPIGPIQASSTNRSEQRPSSR